MVEAVREVKLPHAHSSVAKVVTISAGVQSIIPTHDASPRTLTEQADAALYQAKESGRNRACGHLTQS